MKKLSAITMAVSYTLALGFILSTTSGCAAQARASRSDLAAPQRVDRRPVVPTRRATVAPVRPVAGMVPPARPERSGPPQNFAWLYTPPMGCEQGPMSMQVTNQTQYYLSLFIDGRQLQVRAADGMFPHLPPGETAYVCFNGLGQHVVTGVAYAATYGQLMEVDRFRSDRTYTVSSLGNSPRHGLTINDQFLRWH